MNNLSPWVKVALIVGVVLLGLIVVFWLLPWTLAHGAFAYAFDSIRNVTGWSPFLVKGLLVVLFLPFAWAVTEVLRFDLLGRLRALGEPKEGRRLSRRRLIARVVLVAYIGGYFFLMYGASRDSFFGHSGGEVLKYYAVTPEGVRWFDAPGFDPKYGIELKPATPEIIANLERASRGQVPQRVMIESISDVEFFNSLDGSPQVWYWQASTGEIELFSSSGLHPTYGEPLQPINGEIIQLVEQQLDWQVAEKRRAADALAEQQRAQASAARQRETMARLNRLFNLSEANADTAVAILRGSSLAPSLTDHVAERLGGSSSFFKPAFVSEGVFQQVFDGQTEVLRSLSARDLPDRIVLGTVEVDTGRSDLRADMVRAEARVVLRKIDTTAGFRSTVARGTGIAARFVGSEAEAEALIAAAEDALDKLR